MSAPTQEALFQAYENAYRITRIDTFCLFASSAWFLYDYFLTLEDEVRFIWMQKWGSSKFLFLFMRYFAPIMIASNVAVTFIPNLSIPLYVYTTLVSLESLTASHSCDFYFYWEGLGGCVLLYSVEILLQFRIYAMYERNKRLMAFNAMLFFCEIVYMVVVFCVGISRGQTLAAPLGMTGCFGNMKKYLFSVWFPAMVFELNLVLQALYKAIQTSRAGVTLGFGARLTLLDVIVRDSVAYFILIFVALLINCLLFSVDPTGLALAAVPISHASMSVGGSRVVLNVQRAFIESESRGRSVSTGRPFTTLTRLTSLSDADTFEYRMKSPQETLSEWID